MGWLIMRLGGVSSEIIMSAFRVVILRARLRGRVEVGFDTQIGPGCRILVAKTGVVRLRGATLKRSVTLEASANAVLDIGKVHLGPGTVVSARERVTIGDGSGLAEYATVRDHDHRLDAPLDAWEFTVDPITIKNDVWIGSKATIVAGVTLEDHAVCGANAVVTHNVPAWQLVGGVPARPIGSGRPRFTTADGVFTPSKADDQTMIKGSGSSHRTSSAL
jgi:acetyltransferase-like isoleucine patch superfamily enzyme